MFAFKVALREKLVGKNIGRIVIQHLLDSMNGLKRFRM